MTSLGNLATAELVPNQQIHADLLAPLEADTGAFASQVTVMRIVGSMSLRSFATGTTEGSESVFYGFAWVSSIIASLSAGDTSIPDPAELGAREALWLHRGVLRGRNTANGNTDFFSVSGQLEGHVELDITQMRKQQSPDDKLVLIVNSGFGLTEDVALDYFLHTMVALP